MIGRGDAGQPSGHEGRETSSSRARSTRASSPGSSATVAKERAKAVRQTQARLVHHEAGTDAENESGRRRQRDSREHDRLDVPVLPLRSSGGDPRRGPEPAERSPGRSILNVAGSPGLLSDQGRQLAGPGRSHFTANHWSIRPRGVRVLKRIPIPFGGPTAMRDSSRRWSR